MCGVVKYNMILDNERILAVGCLILFAACVQSPAVPDIATTFMSFDVIDYDEPRVKIKLLFYFDDNVDVIIITSTMVDIISFVFCTECCGISLHCNILNQRAMACFCQEEDDERSSNHKWNVGNLERNESSKSDLQFNLHLQMLSRFISMDAAGCKRTTTIGRLIVNIISSNILSATLTAAFAMRNRKSSPCTYLPVRNASPVMVTTTRGSNRVNLRDVIQIRLNVTFVEDIAPSVMIIRQEQASHVLIRKVAQRKSSAHKTYVYFVRFTHGSTWKRICFTSLHRYTLHKRIRSIGMGRVPDYVIRRIMEQRIDVNKYSIKLCFNVNFENTDIDVYHRYNNDSLSYYLIFIKLLSKQINSQISKFNRKYTGHLSSEYKTLYETVRIRDTVNNFSNVNGGLNRERSFLLIFMVVYFLRSIINQALSSKHSDIFSSSLHFFFTYILHSTKKFIAKCVDFLLTFIHNQLYFNHWNYVKCHVHNNDELYNFCFDKKSQEKKVEEPSIYHQLHDGHLYNLERKCYKSNMLSFLYRLGDYQTPVFLQHYPVFKTVLDNHFESSLSDESYSSCNKIELIRLGTYKNFPAENKPWYLNLARAGFFYTGESDIVECFQCHERHGNWRARDDPFEVHRRISPSCGFINGDNSSNIPVDRGDKSSTVSESLNSYSQKEQSSCQEHDDNCHCKGAFSEVKENPERNSVNHLDEKFPDRYGHCQHGIRQHHDASGFNVGYQHANVIEAGPSCGLDHNVKHNGHNVGLTSPNAGTVNGHNAALTSPNAGTVNGHNAALTSPNAVTVNGHNAALTSPNAGTVNSHHVTNGGHGTQREGSTSTLQNNLNFNRNGVTDMRSQTPTSTRNGGNSSEIQQSSTGGSNHTTAPANARSTISSMRQNGQHSTRSNQPLNLQPLGITSTSPKYPEFAVSHIRASTFHGWPPTTGQTPRRMAEAGFIYAGYSDYVRCFFCGEGLSEWEREDDPWIEHAKWFPHCHFLRQSKGDTFIYLVHQSLENQVTRHRSTTNPAMIAPPAISPPNPPTPEPPQNDPYPGNTSAAIQSIQEMGYTRDIIDTAIAYLQSERTQINAHNIMEVILSTPSVTNGELPSNDRASTPPPEETSVNLSSNDMTSSNTNHSSSMSSESSSFILPSLSTCNNGDGGPREHEASDRSNPHRDAVSNVSSQMQELSFTDIKSIVDENRSLKESRLCKICLDNEASIAFVPCGHLVCCAECAYAMRKCPICRRFVEGRIKTWMT